MCLCPSATKRTRSNCITSPCILLLSRLSDYKQALGSERVSLWGHGSIAPYNLIMSVFVSSNDVTAIGGMYPRLAAIGADVATIGGMYLSLGTCYRTLVRFTRLTLCEYLDNCICVTHDALSTSVSTAQGVAVWPIVCGYAREGDASES